MPSIDLQNTAEAKWKQQNDAKQKAADAALEQARVNDANSKAITGGVIFGTAAVGIGTAIAAADSKFMAAAANASSKIASATSKVSSKIAGGGKNLFQRGARGLRKINFQMPGEGRVYNSWSDFYINMQIDMAENRFIAFGVPLTKAGAELTAELTGLGHFENVNKTFELLNHVAFADSLCDNYDKTIRNGNTLFGGGYIHEGGGHVSIMKAVLTTILLKTRETENGDLLRDIGPAMKAYWGSAFLSCKGTLGAPTQPCVPFVGVKNIKSFLPKPVTIPGTNLIHSANHFISSKLEKLGAIGEAIVGKGEFIPTPPVITANLCLFSGIWTPIVVKSNSQFSPFLISFIASAAIHLLTVAGILTAWCNYAATGPTPLPGVLPWAAYIVKPISNPIPTIKAYSHVELAAALVGKVSEFAHSVESKHEEGQHLTLASFFASTQQTTADALINENNKKAREKAEAEGRNFENLDQEPGTPEERLVNHYKKTGEVNLGEYISSLYDNFKAGKDSRSIESSRKLKVIDSDFQKNKNLFEPNIQML